MVSAKEYDVIYPIQIIKNYKYYIDILYVKNARALIIIRYN